MKKKKKKAKKRKIERKRLKIENLISVKGKFLYSKAKMRGRVEKFGGKKRKRKHSSFKIPKLFSKTQLY